MNRENNREIIEFGTQETLIFQSNQPLTLNSPERSKREIWRGTGKYPGTVARPLSAAILAQALPLYEASCQQDVVLRWRV
jgi:hypothetical protein